MFLAALLSPVAAGAEMSCQQALVAAAMAEEAFLQGEDSSRVQEAAAGLPSVADCDRALDDDALGVLARAAAYAAYSRGDRASAQWAMCQARELDSEWNLPSDWAGTDVAALYGGTCTHHETSTLDIEPSDGVAGLRGSLAAGIETGQVTRLVTGSETVMLDPDIDADHLPVSLVVHGRVSVPVVGRWSAVGGGTATLSPERVNNEYASFHTWGPRGRLAVVGAEWSGPVSTSTGLYWAYYPDVSPVYGGGGNDLGVWVDGTFRLREFSRSSLILRGSVQLEFLAGAEAGTAGIAIGWERGTRLLAERGQ